MENQQQRAKRGREEATDRISELPEPLLHHVLCFLPPKDAVQTCILSKSWRHLGPTRPKIEIRQTLFGGNNTKFLSVLENTLQRYVDQKLPIQEFILETCMLSFDPDFESMSLSLNEWIPIVVTKMGVKKFELRATDFRFPLPSVVFQAKFLEELSLYGECKVNNCINVNLQMLKRLVLRHVQIEDEAFEKIMSNCPLIQHVDVHFCYGLRTIKVDNAHNLKHFDFSYNSLDSIGFNDAPSLETINISCCEVWNGNYFFPRLKSLNLFRVRLPTEFLNNLSSNNCPCLEELQLWSCSGFTEFKLSIRSIKRLVFSISESCPIEVISIDAANMLYFELELSRFVPSISFVTTLSECKSRIHVWRSSDTNADFSSTWFLELYEFLKAFSQSQISLQLSSFPPNLTNQGTYGGEPVVVEHLCLSADNYYHNYSSSALPSFFNSLFRICRPRYVGPTLHATNSQKSLLAKKIWKALGKKRQRKIWKQQDLEKTSIQVLDEKTKEWRPGQKCEFFANQSIRFWLEWKKFKHFEMEKM